MCNVLCFPVSIICAKNYASIIDSPDANVYNESDYQYNASKIYANKSP